MFILRKYKIYIYNKKRDVYSDIPLYYWEVKLKYLT